MIRRLVSVCLAAVLVSATPVSAQETRLPRVTVVEFDGSLVNVAREFTTLVEMGHRKIEIRIDSFGGSVFAGLAFIQYIEDVKEAAGVETVCIVDTKAMSMGFALLQSKACDVRLMTKRSILLAHNGSSGGQGTVEEMEETVDILKAINRALAEICGARLSIGVKGYLKKVNSRRAWVMTWEEALKVKAVDGVI